MEERSQPSFAREPGLIAMRRAIVLTVLVGLPTAAVLTYRHLDDVTRDCYAVWWVADMVVVHMEDNDGAWPNDWDELHRAYRICVERTSARPWSFEELRDRVEVDFDVDPTRLPIDGVPQRVIWLRDGSDHHWERREPNTLVQQYLRERHVSGEPSDGP
jgi:hypothetical protein